MVTIPFPQLTFCEDGSSFFKLIDDEELSVEEKYIVLIALIPHIQPNCFESIIQSYLPNGGDLPEIGGVKVSHYRGMLPTGETAQFVIAGNNLDKRLTVQQLLLGESKLVTDNILELETVKQGEPMMSGRFMISQEWLHQLLTGNDY